MGEGKAAGDAAHGLHACYLARGESVLGLGEVGMIHETGVSDGGEVVLGWFRDTGTSFHSFVMKGDTCSEVCRICRQKRFSGWCVWRGAPEILFLISLVKGRTVNLRVALRANLVMMRTLFIFQSYSVYHFGNSDSDAET